MGGTAGYPQQMGRAVNLISCQDTSIQQAPQSLRLFGWGPHVRQNCPLSSLARQRHQLAGIFTDMQLWGGMQPAKIWVLVAVKPCLFSLFLFDSHGQDQQISQMILMRYDPRGLLGNILQSWGIWTSTLGSFLYPTRETIALGGRVFPVQSLCQCRGGVM